MISSWSTPKTSITNEGLPVPKFWICFLNSFVFCIQMDPEVEVLAQIEDAEEWRIVAGFDNYSVSNLGSVRNDTTQRILRPQTVGGDYLQVRLYDRSSWSAHYVHKLVATAFLGDSNGFDVDHIDRNRQNNHVSNLRYCSRSDNNRNKSSNHGVVYQFVDTLPDEAIELNEYGNHHFDDLYYHDGQFYVFTGVNYRILAHLTNPHGNSVYVQAFDTNHYKTQINVAKYRRSIGDLP
jgi:hypothetical protein